MITSSLSMKIKSIKHTVSVEAKMMLLSLSTISVALMLPNQQTHASTLSQVRNAASVLPGLGPPDVYYPSSWKGKWITEQTFTSVNITQDTTRIIPYIQKKYKDNEPLIYTRVYSSFDDSKVVLDRSLTTTSMWRSLLLDKAALCIWEYNNPNVATVQTSDGKLDEYKVMKRSIESGDYFGSSEFYRIAETITSLQYSVPKIYGCRILSRYREEEKDDNGIVSKISGLERMYMYDADTLDINAKPLSIIKSKFVMNRQIS